MELSPDCSVIFNSFLTSLLEFISSRSSANRSCPDKDLQTIINSLLVFPFASVLCLPFFEGRCRARKTLFWTVLSYRHLNEIGLKKHYSLCSAGSRISRRGGVDSRGGYLSKILYVKMKESGPLGGVHWARPLDPPMLWHLTDSR